MCLTGTNAIKPKTESVSHRQLSGISEDWSLAYRGNCVKTAANPLEGKFLHQKTFQGDKRSKHKQ